MLLIPVPIAIVILYLIVRIQRNHYHRCDVIQRH